MKSLSYEDIHFFLDNLLPQEIIDLERFSFIETLYWTILKAESERRRQQGKRMRIKLDSQSPAFGYLEYILGKHSSRTTVPIKVVTTRAHIDRFTEELVGIMRLDNAGLDEEDKEFFKYIISELLTNAIDHGEAPPVVSAQMFPKKNEVEIAVADTGLGFLHTIGRKHKVGSSSEAIELAMKKNVSGAISYMYGGTQRNVGIGLYVISRLVRDARGVMFIVSDDSVVRYSPSGHRVSTISNKWQGAIVVIKFNLKSFTEVLDFGFRTYMDMIIGEDIEEKFF